MAEDPPAEDRARSAGAAPGVSPDGELPEGLREAFEHLGRLRFDQFMELALYAPATGFFAVHGGAGRRTGDFMTSPEVGPTFGAVLARHLDELWRRLDRPSPFTVIEGGAGRGALAIAVAAAAPECAPALHWVLVERSAALRDRQGEHLELTGLVGLPEPGGLGAGSPGEGGGPWFTSLAAMPEPSAASITGAVVANELLDNIPTRLLARTATTWQEVMVALGDDGRLREELSEVPPVVAEAFDEVAPAAVQDARAPWQPGAAKWVVDAIDLVERGEVLVFDYADTTASMAARPQDQWLRTYRSHQRGSSPLESAGRQDITVEVALDQLPEPDEVCSQAAWLAANGLDELVARAARRWEERAGVGDLAAMRARSVSTEAAALTDESGLGAFKVLRWAVGPAST
ncbi:MAG: SAM-dependent methyltransferase [Microthrixaceae bacterium]|nr:SAM-dependent methyltransferase [Microthrixaceae bacterium]